MSSYGIGVGEGVRLGAGQVTQYLSPVGSVIKVSSLSSRLSVCPGLPGCCVVLSIQTFSVVPESTILGCVPCIKYSNRVGHALGVPSGGGRSPLVEQTFSDMTLLGGVGGIVEGFSLRRFTIISCHIGAATVMPEAI